MFVSIKYKVLKLNMSKNFLGLMYHNIRNIIKKTQ